jgi:predicted nucleotide-binding protein (sugar kinase/HSP70/actin superfamily)
MWAYELVLTKPNVRDSSTEGIFCAGPLACIPNSINGPG